MQAPARLLVPPSAQSTDSARSISSSWTAELPSSAHSITSGGGALLSPQHLPMSSLGISSPPSARGSVEIPPAGGARDIVPPLIELGSSSSADSLLVAPPLQGSVSPRLHKVPPTSPAAKLPPQPPQAIATLHQPDTAPATPPPPSVPGRAAAREVEASSPRSPTAGDVILTAPPRPTPHSSASDTPQPVRSSHAMAPQAHQQNPPTHAQTAPSSATSTHPSDGALPGCAPAVLSAVKPSGAAKPLQARRPPPIATVGPAGAGSAARGTNPPLPTAVPAAATTPLSRVPPNPIAVAAAATHLVAHRSPPAVASRTPGRVPLAAAYCKAAAAAIPTEDAAREVGLFGPAKPPPSPAASSASSARSSSVQAVTGSASGVRDRPPAHKRGSRRTGRPTPPPLRTEPPPYFGFYMALRDERARSGTSVTLGAAAATTVSTSATLGAAMTTAASTAASAPGARGMASETSNITSSSRGTAMPSDGETIAATPKGDASCRGGGEAVGAPVAAVAASTHKSRDFTEEVGPLPELNEHATDKARFFPSHLPAYFSPSCSYIPGALRRVALMAILCPPCVPLLYSSRHRSSATSSAGRCGQPFLARSPPRRLPLTAVLRSHRSAWPAPAPTCSLRRQPQLRAPRRPPPIQGSLRPRHRPR